MRLDPTMVGVAIAALAGLGCSHPSSLGGPTPAPIAAGTIRNAAGDRIGVATLSDSGGAQLAISVADLAPGPHGLHFHAQGACTPPDFASAGPHFNPLGRKHGRLNPDGPHLGDLPNLIVGPDGSADTTFAVAAGLTGRDSSSLVKAGGALVIHAGPDDEETDPSGNSGERVACAVIEPR